MTSRELAGKSVDKYFPNLRGRTDLEFSSPENNQLQQCDVVFFATPHAVAMHSVQPLLDFPRREISLEIPQQDQFQPTRRCEFAEPKNNPPN